MLDATADLLARRLLAAYPPSRAYARADLDRLPLPVGHALAARLTRAARRTARLDGADGVAFEGAEVRAAADALRQAAAAHARFPADAWEPAVREAARLAVHYLVRPAETVSAAVFAEPSARDGAGHAPDGSLAVAEVFDRMAPFAAYPYLREIAARYLDQKGAGRVDRAALERLLRRIDRRMVGGFGVTEWMSLLDPLLALLRPLYADGVPTPLLQAFFEAKGQDDLAHEIDGPAAHTEATLRRALADLLPGAAAGAPASTAEAPALPSAPPFPIPPAPTDEAPEPFEAVYEPDEPLDLAEGVDDPVPVAPLDPLAPAPEPSGVPAVAAAANGEAERTASMEEVEMKHVETERDETGHGEMEGAETAHAPAPAAAQPGPDLTPDLVPDDDAPDHDAPGAAPPFAGARSDERVAAASPAMEAPAAPDLPASGPLVAPEPDAPGAAAPEGDEAPLWQRLARPDEAPLHARLADAPPGDPAPAEAMPLASEEPEALPPSAGTPDPAWPPAPLAPEPPPLTVPSVPAPPVSEPPTPVPTALVAPEPDEAAHAHEDGAEPLWKRLARQQGAASAPAEAPANPPPAPSLGSHPGGAAPRPTLADALAGTAGAPVASAPAAGLPPDAPRTLDALEAHVLGPAASDRRAWFVRELVGGSEADYRAILEQLAAAPSWTAATQVIAAEVFRRHRVNIYSEAAVAFTDAVEARYEARRAGGG